MNLSGRHSEAHSRRDIETCATDVPELSLVYDSLVDPIRLGRCRICPILY